MKFSKKQVSSLLLIAGLSLVSVANARLSLSSAFDSAQRKAQAAHRATQLGYGKAVEARAKVQALSAQFRTVWSGLPVEQKQIILASLETIGIPKADVGNALRSGNIIQISAMANKIKQAQDVVQVLKENFLATQQFLELLKGLGIVKLGGMNVVGNSGTVPMSMGGSRVPVSAMAD